MQIHEIGEYSTAGGDILKLYILEYPRYVSPDFGGGLVPAGVYYCMERQKGPNHLFITDWLAFAHMVNRVAGESVLDIYDDAAVCESLCVPVGMECPDCGCRMTDCLVWDPLGESVECEACGANYVPGEH